MNDTLPPIFHREAYTRAVEREINAWFSEAIFAPLQIVLRDRGIRLDPKYQAIKFDEFGKELRLNAANSALEEALKSGRLQYADGVFSGKFSAVITREMRALGASFDPKAKTFRLAESLIPLELRGILAQASFESKETTKGILDVLLQMQANIASAPLALQFDEVLTKIEADLGRQLVETVTQLSPQKIGLKPQIDDGTRQQLDEGFTRNLNLSIKNFAQERIPELRRRVEQNAFEFGGRTDRLAKIIEAEFGVTKRKAEFLADQETGLLVSKYRAAKYQKIGIKEYIWSTSQDARVRDSHKVLNGHKFSFAAPPCVDRKTGRRCNPGEDYRCRCVPRPVINLAELAA